MPDDEKLAFYLRHREQIEEWASLRSHAEEVLNAELWESARQLALNLPDAGVLLEKRWGYEHVFLPAAVETPGIGMGLAWRKSGLLAAGPTLAVTCIDGRQSDHYEALKRRPLRPWGWLTASISSALVNGSGRRSCGPRLVSWI